MTRWPRPLGALLAALVAVAVMTACGDAEEPSQTGFPQPTCGGLKVQIDPSLPCDQVAEIAIRALRDRAPQQLARGVTAIEVVLADCPRGEVPAQIVCGGSTFAQLVTVTFGSGAGAGLIEPSLTVAVEPVTGAILGIENPLIR